MSITINNTKVSEIHNAIVHNCLVSTSVNDSVCTNTVSPTFIDCNGDYCVSADNSANFIALTGRTS